MGGVGSSAELVRHLIIELSRFTGMRGAVVTQALYDAGFPEEHLPSRPDADRLPGARAAIGWKDQLTRHELDGAMAVLFLRTKYRNGLPGGLLLMWHPTTRWLFVRVTGARKAPEPDFQRWIDRKLLEGVKRFARSKTLVVQQRNKSTTKNLKPTAKRSGHLPKPDPVYFPKLIFLSESLRIDNYEPDFSNWELEPRIVQASVAISDEPYTYNLSDLPTLSDPHAFIRHIVDGYNFAELFFSLATRGSRCRLASPQSSVPMRLGIDRNKGRRWRSLLRMPEYGRGRSRRGPFEYSRSKLT